MESNHPGEIEAVFQIDHTTGDTVPDAGYFHAQWRRTTSAPKGTDYVVVDGISGAGTYLGTNIALTALGRSWWGEGELTSLAATKNCPQSVGLDLKSTPAERGLPRPASRSEEEPEVITFSAPYCGYPHRQAQDTSGRAPYATAMPITHGLHRFHLPDLVHFSSDLKLSLQQIGHDGHDLFERTDDICTTAYWYQTGATLNSPPCQPWAPAGHSSAVT